MKFVTSGGAKIHFKVAGEEGAKRTCLLIHGLNANMAFWHPQFVRELGQDRKLVMYDQRGHGYSEIPPTGYTPADLAADAEKVLDAAGVKTPVDLVAHSFGTVTAMQFLKAHPRRVRSVIILDGRLRLLQPESRLGDWKLFDRWRQHFEKAGIHLTPDMDLDFTLPLYFAGANLDQVHKDLALDGFFVPAKGERAATKYRKLLTETSATRDYREQAGITNETLRTIRVPVLALYGTLSPFLQTMQGLAVEVPGCRTGMIDGGGHNFPFMKPAETSAAIRQFWAATENASRFLTMISKAWKKPRA